MNVATARNLGRPGRLSVDAAGGKSRAEIFFFAISIWVIASFAAFRSRDVDELTTGSGVDWQVIFQAASWGLFGFIAIWLMYRGRFQWSIVRRGPMAWFLAFAVFCLVSSLYSITPAFTAYYSLQSLVLVALICCAGAMLDRLYAVIAIYVLINWTALILGESGLSFGISWLQTARESYISYGGSEGEVWRFSTAFGHPSLLSIVAAIGAVGLAAKRGEVNHRWLLVGWFVLTVLMTLSRTAIVGMAFGLAIVAINRKSLSPWFSLILLASAVSLMIPDLAIRLADLFMRGQSTYEFTSLTGRADIYSAALERANATTFGEGFRSLRAMPLVQDGWGKGVTHAHNAILQAKIDLGYPGVILAVGLMFSLCRYAVTTAYDRAGSVEILAILFPVLAFSTLDSGFAMSVNVFVIVFALVCARARMIHLARARVHGGGPAAFGYSRAATASRNLRGQARWLR